MFCDECGQQIPDTAKFCRYCGAKIGAHLNIVQDDTQLHSTQICNRASYLYEDFICDISSIIYVSYDYFFKGFTIINKKLKQYNHYFDTDPDVIVDEFVLKLKDNNYTYNEIIDDLTKISQTSIASSFFKEIMTGSQKEKEELVSVIIDKKNNCTSEDKKEELKFIFFDSASLKDDDKQIVKEIVDILMDIDIQFIKNDLNQKYFYDHSSAIIKCINKISNNICNIANIEKNDSEALSFDEYSTSQKLGSEINMIAQQHMNYNYSNLLNLLFEFQSKKNMWESVKKTGWKVAGNVGSFLLGSALLAVAPIISIPLMAKGVVGNFKAGSDEDEFFKKISDSAIKINKETIKVNESKNQFKTILKQEIIDKKIINSISIINEVVSSKGADLNTIFLKNIHFLYGLADELSLNQPWREDFMVALKNNDCLSTQFKNLLK